MLYENDLTEKINVLKFNLYLCNKFISEFQINPDYTNQLSGTHV
jgi:hypothetical protein